MNINYNKLKYTITFSLIAVFFGCNTPSEKHLELEAAQISLENNLKMYKNVWDEIFESRNLDLINEEYFDFDASVFSENL